MKLRKDFYIFIGIQLVFLLVGTFFDYSISVAMYDHSSLFSKSVNAVASLPVYMMLAFFSAGIFNSRSRDRSYQSKASAVLGFFFTALFGFLGGYDLLYNMNLYSITMTMAFAIGVFVCCYILTKLICDHHAEQLRKVSKLVLTSWAVILLISLILILFVQRIPFRRLNESIYAFVPWYRPQFVFDWIAFTDRAFPSLIVAWNMLIMYINMFPMFVSRLRFRKAILMIISYSWLFVVAVSQMTLGYAYLSDIAIAMLISTLVMLGTYMYFYREKESSGRN